MTDIAQAFDGEPEKLPADIPRLTTMARRAVMLEREMALLEEAMSNARKEYLDLTRVQLPDVMAEIGLNSFTLADGSKLKVEDFIEGSLPKDPAARASAVTVLESIGGESMIRNEVVVPFERKQHNVAVNLARELQDRGLQVRVQQDVHHMTLKSFVREKLAHGEEVPFEKLGVFVGRRAVVKLAGQDPEGGEHLRERLKASVEHEAAKKK